MTSSVEDYIMARCEETLTKDAHYMELQRQMSDAYRNHNLELYSNLSVQIQSVVEVLVYHAAAHDAEKFLMQ